LAWVSTESRHADQKSEERSRARRRPRTEVRPETDEEWRQIRPSADEKKRGGGGRARAGPRVRCLRIK
jgi:hypothetical protein